MLPESKNPATEAAVVRDLALEASKPQVSAVDIGGHAWPILAHTPSTKVASLENMLPTPMRHRGTVKLLTLHDMHQYLERHTKAAENSPQPNWYPVVYADRTMMDFTAILNHHTGLTPGWMDYRLYVQLKKSRQLQIWIKSNMVRMGQEEFALFLENVLSDIVKPLGAEVLTFAETLEATRTETFKSSITTATGEMKLAYSSERNGEVSSHLITEMELGIPLFEGGDPYSLTVKIYHRVNDGKLTFWYDVKHLEYVLDAAWTDECKFLTETIAEFATVYNGTAPSAMQAQSLS